MRESPTFFTDPMFLESHAIDRLALQALHSKDWGAFLRFRRKTIEHLEHTRAEECGLEYRSDD
jgi:hypothetical protein